MYDTDKARQLQKQSHVRGALSKQFYSNQQSQLQIKRRQMKRILDQQVEQRKRIKERQKQMLENRQRKEEEEIKRYYESVGQRERRVSEQGVGGMGQNNNGSGYQQNSGGKGNEAMYNSQQQQNESLVKRHVQQQQSMKQQHNMKQQQQQRINSRTLLSHDPDPINPSLIPLLSLSQGQLLIHQNRLPSSNLPPHQFSIINSDRLLHQLTYRNFDQHAGNIPLLDLSDQNTFTKTKKKTKAHIRKQPTQRSQRENNHVNNSVMKGSGVRVVENSNGSKGNGDRVGVDNYGSSQSAQQQQQNGSANNILVLQSNQSLAESIKRRHRTISNEQNPTLTQQPQLNILNSRLSKGSKFNDSLINKSPLHIKNNIDLDIPEEIEQMETENQKLKSELKKNQEAISLLIGAVRSNPKLDKFRVQAEKILHNNQHTETYPKTTYQPEKKFAQKKEESALLLPKIKIKHQSIMHDYLLEAAKKARVKQIKSQTHNY